MRLSMIALLTNHHVLFPIWIIPSRSRGCTQAWPCLSTTTRFLDLRTVISCRWETWGGGHRQIMAQRNYLALPLFS